MKGRMRELLFTMPRMIPATGSVWLLAKPAR